jgi:hypothetical protein
VSLRGRFGTLWYRFNRSGNLLRGMPDMQLGGSLCALVQPTVPGKRDLSAGGDRFGRHHVPVRLSDGFDGVHECKRLDLLRFVSGLQ